MEVGDIGAVLCRAWLSGNTADSYDHSAKKRQHVSGIFGRFNKNEYDAKDKSCRDRIVFGNCAWCEHRARSLFEQSSIRWHRM